MYRSIVLFPFLFLVGLMSETTHAQRNSAFPVIQYRLSMEQPQKHYFTVVMTVKDLKKPFMDVVMPVWTPGSYLVREFSRNVQEFSATDAAGQALSVEKTAKNVWRVATRNLSSVVIRYRVYAYEISVRTSFLDDMHGYVNGAGMFMYVDGYLRTPVTLVINPPTGWGSISTALEPAISTDETFVFSAPDFDVLVDSPIEIGTHPVYDFSVRGVPHQVALYGVGNYEADRLIADMKRIVETASGIFGDMPYPRYVFLVQLLQTGSGGLEHTNSTSLQYRRWGFKPESAYKRWLALVAHEYFHVWNVKRIRPLPLGPFDYTRENYTPLLWVAEGITTYYSPLILRRAGLNTPDEFLGWIGSQITDIQSKPGRLVQSVEQAGFDAWIKYYRPNENSDNTTISYYNKGGMIGLILDLEIRWRTGGKKGLDDVLRTLYETYAKAKGRGFTPEEFRQTCEAVAGGTLAEIFDAYVSGVREIDYARYLAHAGLRLSTLPTDGQGSVYLGIRTRKDNGRTIVSHVISDSPAEEYGLNVNDELIAFDGIRVEDEYADRLAERKPSSFVTVTVARDGMLREIDVALGSPAGLTYQVQRIKNPAPEQKAVYENWMQTSWPTRE
ncbi:MAG: M61 family metallopeptidase [candidate division Zixibacteria bacterium]|nr:M61 family metallopeptidase [candidate division Zixibacteria bacterium]